MVIDFFAHSIYSFEQKDYTFLHGYIRLSLKMDYEKTFFLHFSLFNISANGCQLGIHLTKIVSKWINLKTNNFA